MKNQTKNSLINTDSRHSDCMLAYRDKWSGTWTTKAPSVIKWRSLFTGHYRTEQKIKLTGAHVFRCKQRKFKYIFWSNWQYLFIVYSIKLQSLSSFTHFSNSIYSNFLRIKISALLNVTVNDQTTVVIFIYLKKN
jgi:hypothetical protein